VDPVFLDMKHADRPAGSTSPLCVHLICFRKELARGYFFSINVRE